ncbi:MAG: hypothetical protein ABR922_18000 [Streptosporangiaceae bacterium]
MAGRIEDYAIIGGMQAAALVCSDGSIDGLVRRYELAEGQKSSVDGLSGGEGAFLGCIWLANALQLTGQPDEAAGMFEHLLSFRNDVGLLSEDYAPPSWEAGWQHAAGLQPLRPHPDRTQHRGSRLTSPPQPPWFRPVTSADW